MELKIESVSKRYRGAVWGLRDFSLEIHTGILGLVGPNGAGKSTLMRILATVTRPTGGRVTWNGLDTIKSPNPLRAVLGYLPQDFGIYPNLNAVEFLTYLAAIKGLEGESAHKRIDGLLQVVGLTEARKRPLGGFSGGMRQRLGIAQALLNDPQLLIVDEPTSGLDPEERVRFRNLLSDLSGNRIVILSTHIITDVEAAATEIAIITQGRLQRHCAPEALLQTVEGKIWLWIIPSDALTEVQQKQLVCSAIRRSDGVHVRLVADAAPAAEAQPVIPSLEDAYLHCLKNSREERVQ
ncbi:MAG: ABC transporter ATP-binding protein [Anaerolineales bacterium]|nr:ABC transporter ATP-binding protein [Anaerolineales bacterium]